VLRQGFAASEAAELRLDRVATAEIAGTLNTVGGLFLDAPVTPLAGAEADVLGDLSFTGTPLRVFVSFVQTTDNAGDALLLTALFPEQRIELRVLRGQPVPLYGIFDLTR